MAEEKVKLIYEAQIRDFESEVKRIPGISDAAVKKMTTGYAKGLKKMDVATSDTTKGIKNLAGAMGFGDKAEKIGKLSEGIKAIGFSGIAAGAGIAVAGAAMYGLAAAFADTLAHATELAPKLESLAGQEIISDSSVESARMATAQIGNLSLITSGFAGVLVDAYAPAIEVATSATVGLGVGALNAYKGLEQLASKGSGVVDTFIAVNLAINPVAWALENLVEKGREAESALEDDAAALDAWLESKKRHEAADEKLLESTKRLNEETGRKREAAMKVATAAAEKRSSDEMALWDEAAAIELESYTKLEKAKEQAAKDYAAVQEQLAVEEMALWDEAAAQELASFIKTEDAKKAIDAQGAALRSSLNQQLYGEAMSLGAQLADQEQARHEDELAIIDDRMAADKVALRAAIKNGDTERAADIQGRIDGDKVRRDLEVKQAKRAHAASKAIAIMGIAVSTGQATMALLASPAIAIAAYAAPAIAAGIAVGAGALQIAAVMASPAPKFHTGLAPDERPATLTAREAVLTPRATADLGGPRAVEAMNRGAYGGGGAPSATVLYLDGRAAGKITANGATQRAAKIAIRAAGSGGRSPLGKGRNG